MYPGNEVASYETVSTLSAELQNNSRSSEKVRLKLTSDQKNLPCGQTWFPDKVNIKDSQFIDEQKPTWAGSLYVSGKLPTYSSPKSTLRLTCHRGQNVGLGVGWGGRWSVFQKRIIIPWAYANCRTNEVTIGGIEYMAVICLPANPAASTVHNFHQ